MRCMNATTATAFVTLYENGCGCPLLSNMNLPVLNRKTTDVEMALDGTMSRNFEIPTYHVEADV